MAILEHARINDGYIFAKESKFLDLPYEGSQVLCPIGADIIRFGTDSLPPSLWSILVKMVDGFKMQREESTMTEEGSSDRRS